MECKSQTIYTHNTRGLRGSKSGIYVFDKGHCWMFSTFIIVKNVELQRTPSRMHKLQ